VIISQGAGTGTLRNIGDPLTIPYLIFESIMSEENLKNNASSAWGSGDKSDAWRRKRRSSGSFASGMMIGMAIGIMIGLLLGHL